jgi:hypothetical protein
MNTNNMQRSLIPAYYKCNFFCGQLLFTFVELSCNNDCTRTHTKFDCKSVRNTLHIFPFVNITFCATNDWYVWNRPRQKLFSIIVYATDCVFRSLRWYITVCLCACVSCFLNCLCMYVCYTCINLQHVLFLIFYRHVFLFLYFKSKIKMLAGQKTH